MTAGIGVFFSISIVFVIAGVVLKISAETDRMVLIEHLREDWTYRLPFYLRNNRYRGLSRWSYQLLAILYYIFKAIAIIVLCGYYYILVGLHIAIRCIFGKIRYLRNPKMIEMEQEDTLGIVANNIANIQSKHLTPTKKQISNGATRGSTVKQSAVLSESVISNLWKHGSETAWHEALEHYYELLNAEAKEVDSYMENICADEIAQLSVTEFYDFLYDRYFV